jgi:hypothetical protein
MAIPYSVQPKGMGLNESIIADCTVGASTNGIRTEFADYCVDNIELTRSGFQ